MLPSDFIRDFVEELRRVDGVEGGGAGFEVATEVALGQQRLHPLVFAVGRQVSADVECLAAPGRDRNDAVEDDDVADRPGEDREDEGDEEDGGGGEAGAPVTPVPG